MRTDDLKALIEPLASGQDTYSSLLKFIGHPVGAVVPQAGDSAEPGSPASTARTREDLEYLNRELSQILQSQANQADTITQLSRTAVQDTPSTSTDGGGSAIEAVGHGLSSVFRTGFGLAPLVTGLLRLFGGGKAEEPPSLDYYLPPESINFDFGLRSDSSSAIQQVRYAESGLPEAVRARSNLELPPVTIQVQAIDSRSFLDHSDAIARAVREAILSSSTLNDVMAEL